MTEHLWLLRSTGTHPKKVLRMPAVSFKIEQIWYRLFHMDPAGDLN